LPQSQYSHRSTVSFFPFSFPHSSYAYASYIQHSICVVDRRPTPSTLACAHLHCPAVRRAVSAATCELPRQSAGGRRKERTTDRVGGWMVHAYSKYSYRRRGSRDRSDLIMRRMRAALNNRVTAVLLCCSRAMQIHLTACMRCKALKAGLLNLKGTHKADSIIESKIIYYLEQCGLGVLFFFYLFLQ
jgi:hypothetical protein